jgi:hypothetical protein
MSEHYGQANLTNLQQEIQLLYLEQITLAIELGKLQMLNVVIKQRKEFIKIMLQGILETVSITSVLGAASYVAVATAVANPIGLTVLGTTVFLSGMFLQFQQSKNSQIVRK